MDVEIVKLVYSENVKSRFKAVIGLTTLLIVVMPFLHVFHSGWLQLLVVMDIFVALYYWYRIRRFVEISDAGIKEVMGRQSTFWSWKEIAEIREIQSMQPGAEPSRRLTLEHNSTHQVSIDTQMGDYERGKQIIEQNWIREKRQAIEISKIPFFFIKYW